jgi:protein-L-isoaspartate O-methyltransferase
LSNRTIKDATEILKPIAEIYGINARWLAVRTEDYFKTLDFTNMCILDVGAGNGMYTCCVAALGAEKITALEPELDGSRHGLTTKFGQVLNELKLSNIELINKSLGDYNSPPQAFDMIYLLAVINHIDEKHVGSVNTNSESKEIYKEHMQPLFDWLVPGGKLVITDASDTSIFTPLLNTGILKKHPFQPTLDWDIHQHPKVWNGLLLEIGFESVNYRWATNWRYSWMPRFLVDNPITAKIYSSLFVIHAVRP